jgi:hypothetical protein
VLVECGFLPQISDLFFFSSLEELREHFHAYGEIESINVKTDPNTGRSRGFAFIVFSHADSIDKVRALVLLCYNVWCAKLSWRIFMDRLTLAVWTTDAWNMFCLWLGILHYTHEEFVYDCNL